MKVDTRLNQFYYQKSTFHGVTNTIFQWLNWNANFHAEHHLFPRAVPWHLEKLHFKYGKLFLNGPVSYFGLIYSIMVDFVKQGKWFKCPDFSKAPDFFFRLQKGTKDDR